MQKRGETCVIVEAAVPAVCPPGDVAKHTRGALNSGDEIRVDPMF